MKNPEFALFFMTSILLVCIIFYAYNKIADEYNKRKIQDFLKDRFLNNDFMSLNSFKFDYFYDKIVESFGKSDRCALNEKDQEILSNILGFEVKPYDKFVMPHFFGGTLYSRDKYYEGIKIHHIVFKVYKQKYVCVLGEKEYFHISVERHHGTCHWDGKEMHYPYRIEGESFKCTLDDFEKTWQEVKKYMFD